MKLMRLKAIWVNILLFVLFSECNESSLVNTNKNECIVVYKKNCLDKKDLKNISENLSAQDSTRIVSAYIKEWLLSEAMYEQAQKNVIIDEAELEKSVREFKKQLFISEYLKNYIRQNIDTGVSDKEISDYYQQYKNSFKLSSNIIQIYYVKLNDNDKDINTFKKLLSTSAKDKKQLNNFIIEKAMGYFTEDSLWLKWDDVIKEIPTLKTYEINYLPKGKTMEWKDGMYYYYIKIKDYKVKNEYSPLAYEKDKIRKIILNERKNNLVTELKNRLLEEIGYK